MVFDRLAIGTANWGKEYNGAKVSEDDQKRILEYCQEVGIDMIDTADAYENNVFDIASDFKIVNKGDGEFVHENTYAYLSHGMIWSVFYNKIVGVKKIGLSIYEPQDIPELGGFGIPYASVLQVPYSLYDRRFEPYFPKLKEQGIEIHVRSIFLRGRILKDYNPWTCIAFCLMNPYINRVIIGVDSLEQLRENLQPLKELCNSQVNDENIIDPRNWKEEK